MYRKFCFGNPANKQGTSKTRLWISGGADKSLAFPIFLFSTQPKEFFLDGLKKFEQRSHKCMELRGEYVEEIHFFSPVACFLYKAKDLSAPPPFWRVWRECGVLGGLTRILYVV
jgi:hypothetical protein